jgi:hypothetical protein
MARGTLKNAADFTLPGHQLPNCVWTVLNIIAERLRSRYAIHFCMIDESGRTSTTRPPGLPAVVLKVGTLDEPSFFGSPQMAIYTIDKQAFHQIPDGLPTFARLPPR